MCACAVELCKYKPPSGGNEVLVAVKRLLPSILKSKEELLAFVEETKLLRKLRHRFCPAVTQIFRHGLEKRTSPGLFCAHLFTQRLEMRG